MPPLVALLPTIAAITSIAGTGVGVGLELSNLGGGGAPTPTTPGAPAPQTSTTNAAQTAAVSSTLPTLQSLTGGSLSPEYAAQWGSTQAGLGNNPAAAGNIIKAINDFYGLTAPGTTGLTGPSSTSTAPAPGTSTSSPSPDILSLLTKAIPQSSGSGGGGGTSGFSAFLGMAIAPLSPPGPPESGVD